ncbi:cyclin-related 2, partial [Ascodesmis nigricans]
AIAKKFYSKSAPTIPLEPYLFRLHRFCPLSTAVYLTASFYLHKLVMVEQLIELTPLTAHRLLLAALRVASKTIEDLQHAHARFAKVSGCSPEELRRLEVAFCYAMDFDLKVDCEMLEGQYMMLRGAVEGMATGR